MTIGLIVTIIVVVVKRRQHHLNQALYSQPLMGGAQQEVYTFHGDSTHRFFVYPPQGADPPAYGWWDYKAYDTSEVCSNHIKVDANSAICNGHLANGDVKQPAFHGDVAQGRIFTVYQAGGIINNPVFEFLHQPCTNAEEVNVGVNFTVYRCRGHQDMGIVTPVMVVA